MWISQHYIIMGALHYKSEGRRFDSQWCHQNSHGHNPSSCTVILVSNQPLTEMSTRNISWGVKAAGYIGLTTLPPSCAECLETLALQGLSRPVMGLLYHYFYIITNVRKTYMEMIQVHIITSIWISNVSNQNLSFYNVSVFLCACLI